MNEMQVPGTPGNIMTEKRQQLLNQLHQMSSGDARSWRTNLYDEILGRHYISKDESRKAGKKLREKYPRGMLGTWTVQAGRSDGVDLILEEEKGRVSDLLPIRHQRMAASPFAFYRASAGLMAHDLSAFPPVGITVQTCGDAHIANFGMFQSPERNLVFDINDFDETLPGPWEWDVKRLLTSVEICGRERGFTRNQREESVLSAARTYRESMRRFSDEGNLQVWYDHLDVGYLYEKNRKAMGNEAASAVHKAMEKAFSRNSDKAVSKLTEMTDEGLRIVSQPPLVVPVREMKAESKDSALQWLSRARLEYRLSLPRERRSLIDQYQVVDIARKVVGVGSVGTRDWIMVMQGRENGDYLVLQMKEAGESCLEQYVGKSRFLEHGRRVVEGQRAIQTAGDILLGWSRVVREGEKPEDYYVRQMWDGKGSIDLDLIGPDGLTGTADLCAWVLAHAHAKTGDRHQIAGYLGKGDKFDKAMLEFSRNYADQNEADYAMFMEKIRSGLIETSTKE